MLRLTIGDRTLTIHDDADVQIAGNEIIVRAKPAQQPAAVTYIPTVPFTNPAPYGTPIYTTPGWRAPWGAPWNSGGADPQ